MADCTDYPTPEDAKRFKNNAGSVDEFVTSDSDTFVDQDGGEHKTVQGHETDASNQRDQFNATFQAQFVYKHIGNISDYVGDSLPEADKLNSYQYPDDSKEWYGPIQSQSFPISIPADPSSDDKWALVNALTTAHGDARYESNRSNCTFIFEGDSITEGNTIGGYKYSDVVSTLGFASGWITRTLNRAVGGSQIAPSDNAGNNISDRYATQVFPHRPEANGGDGGTVAYLFLLIGTNDLDTRFGNKSAQTVVTQLTTYIQQAMTDGFTVVLQTILPRKSNQAGWNVQTEKYRLGVNENIRRGSIPADIVADTESFVNDVTSSAMFHDGIHPTVLGSDMIAVYLNNVMLAGGSLESGNVLQGRSIQGLFESKDKTVVKVGSDYMRTSLGTDLIENNNGFLVMENLRTSNPDAKLWNVETGSAGDKLVFKAVNDAYSLANPVMTFGRNGMRSWWEAGNVGQKTIIGTPQSDNDSAPIYMGNLTSGLGVDESNWGWVTGGSGDARQSSLFLRTISDSFLTQKTAVEFKRSGDELTSMAVFAPISTAGASVTDSSWAFGSIVAGGGSNAVNVNKYLEVEVNGTLVRLAVINDPDPT